MDQLSNDPNNTVVGIIRNKPPTAERVANELADRKNITLLEADLTNYDATKVSYLHNVTSTLDKD